MREEGETVKKIEAARIWVEEHRTLFQCPRCGAPYCGVHGNSLVCSNGHAIDFNKHGFLHFLSGQANDEYGTALFAARRRLLQAGLFDPLVEAVCDCMSPHPQTILDVGTGEGTPAAKLLENRSGKKPGSNPDSAYCSAPAPENQTDVLVGFDISKAGITLATQLACNAFFCVANLRELPFREGAFSTVVEFFSPSDYREFNRMLTDGGLLIKVVPEPDHLKELRSLLFADGDRRRTYSNDAVLSLFKSHYPNATSSTIRYRFAVPEELRASLVQMSPLQWGREVDAPQGSELAELSRVTIAARILVGKRGDRAIEKTR